MTCKSTVTDMTVRIFDVRFEKQKMSCRQPNCSNAHNAIQHKRYHKQQQHAASSQQPVCQPRQITRTAFQRAKTEAWLLKNPASVNERCVIALARW